MSGNNNDQPNQGQPSPDLPPVNLPPSPELPPLPWEQEAVEQQAQAAPAAPLQPVDPYAADPQAGQAPAAHDPYAAAPQQPVDPYAANAQAPQVAPGADPYAAAAAQQQDPGFPQPPAYGQQPAQPGYPQPPAYGQQPVGGPGQPGGYLAPPPPAKKRSWIVWVVIVVVIAIAIGVSVLGNALHWFDGRSDEEAAGEVDVPLTEAVPEGLGFVWNIDGVADDKWQVSDQGEWGFEASADGSVCSFVGYTAPLADLGVDAGGASDDAAASTANFQAYVDSLGADPSVKSQDIEEAGTVAIETSAGTVEFQAYNVNLHWTDENNAVTKERWYWRTFVDSDVAMQAYVSCGQDNISAEIDSLHQLTID